ncbi:Arm DNA-binding domain-containing protein [Allorhizobium terrae]|uniref:Arm DNA-binding domain-containing protein n=1 Tax=Allorhizobium terrae TaxID=1848972 RepID=UPI0038B23A49
MSGSKLWRSRYRVDGKEKLLALGAYPHIAWRMRERRAIKPRPSYERVETPLS